MAPFWLLSLSIFSASIVLVIWSPDLFTRYFGNLPPLIVVSLAIAGGGVSLGILASRWSFRVLDPRQIKTGMRIAAFCAFVFGAFIIASDLVEPFPHDINVLPPQSLLFYPVMGFLVECVFHLLALTILLIVLTALFRGERTIWPQYIGLAAVAFLEPGYQLMLMVTREGLSFAALLVGIHILAFNFTQLYLFRRYDFMTMFAFRIFYYLVWHILWGSLRLNLL